MELLRQAVTRSDVALLVDLAIDVVGQRAEQLLEIVDLAIVSQDLG